MSTKYCTDHQPQLPSGASNLAYRRAKRSVAQFDMELGRLNRQCANRSRPHAASGDPLVDRYFHQYLLSQTVQPADKGELRNQARLMVEEEQLIAGTKMEVYPNPTYVFDNVSFKLDQSRRVSLRLTGADGRLLRQSSMELGAGTQLLPFSLQGLPQGVYVLHVQTEVGSATEKIVKK